MSLNVQCPRCGSTNVQLGIEQNKHGCLWLILFGWYYVIWWFCKLLIAIYIFLLWDWWRAIISKCSDKGYVWISSRMMQNKTKTYYCHNCSNNFRA